MTLTAVQRMLSLAFVAYLDSGEIEGSVCDNATKLAPKIGLGVDALNLLAGADYQVVWGPAVFTFNFGGIIPTFSDNVLYVVQDRLDPTQYIVATSGTDNFSLADWFLEDFWTGTTVPWPYGARANDARVSVSSILGLMILQSLVPCAGLPGAGTTLGGFLRAMVKSASSPITITTTGHSLGGSLAPLMALWLRDTQGIDNVAPRDQWDPQSSSTLIAYSFAGATSGDASWARLFDSRFDAEHAFRVWNRYDVVPHAWAVDTLLQVPTLYGKLDPMIQRVANRVIAAVKDLGYRQFQPDAPPLPGSTLIEGWQTGWEFWLQAAYQHTVGYFLGVGLEPPAWVREQMQRLESASR